MDRERIGKLANMGGNAFEEPLVVIGERVHTNATDIMRPWRRSYGTSSRPASELRWETKAVFHVERALNHGECIERPTPLR